MSWTSWCNKYLSAIYFEHCVMMSNYVITVYMSFWSWHIHGSHSVCLPKPGVTPPFVGDLSESDTICLCALCDCVQRDYPPCGLDSHYHIGERLCLICSHSPWGFASSKVIAYNSGLRQCTRLWRWKGLRNFVSLKPKTPGIFLETNKSLMCSFYQSYI
jgi:hypothetical protein